MKVGDKVIITESEIKNVIIRNIPGTVIAFIRNDSTLDGYRYIVDLNMERFWRFARFERWYPTEECVSGSEYNHEYVDDIIDKCNIIQIQASRVIRVIDKVDVVVKLPKINQTNE